MKIYKVEYTDEHGENQDYGYFCSKDNAELMKSKAMDYGEIKKWKHSIFITEIETQD